MAGSEKAGGWLSLDSPMLTAAKRHWQVFGNWRTFESAEIQRYYEIAIFFVRALDAANVFAELATCATIEACATKFGSCFELVKRPFAARFVQMILPRFTIRALLVILTIGAFISVIVGMAFRGHYWAIGFTVGLLNIFFFALVHAACFGIVWLTAQATSRSEVQPARHAE